MLESRIFYWKAKYSKLVCGLLKHSLRSRQHLVMFMALAPRRDKGKGALNHLWGWGCSLVERRKTRGTGHKVYAWGLDLEGHWNLRLRISGFHNLSESKSARRENGLYPHVWIWEVKNCRAHRARTNNATGLRLQAKSLKSWCRKQDSNL
jgi:hypothetical protein